MPATITTSPNLSSLSLSLHPITHTRPAGLTPPCCTLPDPARPPSLPLLDKSLGARACGDGGDFPLPFSFGSICLSRRRSSVPSLSLATSHVPSPSSLGRLPFVSTRGHPDADKLSLRSLCSSCRESSVSSTLAASL